MESEGHEEKYRAVINGGYPNDEPVGQMWDRSSRGCSPTLYRADGFLNSAQYIEAVRQRLSPKTQADLDELGMGDAEMVQKPPDSPFWNLANALYCYLYGRLASLGIDVAGASTIGLRVDFGIVDYANGEPNARYWGLKLLHENFGPGDKPVHTICAIPEVYA